MWQGAVNIPKDATYDEYLDLTFPEDKMSEQMLDPLSLSGPSPFSGSSSNKPPPEVRGSSPARCTKVLRPKWYIGVHICCGRPRDSSESA
jgi:hypothetical protein